MLLSQDFVNSSPALFTMRVYVYINVYSLDSIMYEAEATAADPASIKRYMDIHPSMRVPFSINPEEEMIQNV